MVSFFKKDLLVFWRDRKEVLISLLAPILIIIVLNFAFSGMWFGDSAEIDINAGLVFEDDEALGLEQFEETVRAMDIPDMEKETMIEQAANLSPSGLMASFFSNPELSAWISTQELSEKDAIEQVENGKLDALVKIPEGFTYDVLGQMMLDEPADTAIRIQMEEHSTETDTLTDIIDNYVETLNFQFALGTVTDGETAEPTLPQGGREAIEGVEEMDIAQYFTVAMSSLFTLFIAATVAMKTATEKRERVFNRILLTNSHPFSYLMGKVFSTFCFAWLQLMIVFSASHLLLGIFSGKSIEFWLGVILIVTFFALTVAGLSAIFTSITITLNNINTANGLFTMIIMTMAALGGNFFPLEGFPVWMQGISEWIPNGITVSVFTEFLQYGDSTPFVVPMLKQFGFFIVFLIIGMLLFPRRGRE